MDFLPKDLQKYVEDHTQGESKLLRQIDRETHLKVLKPRMLSGHLQGRVLAMITHMIQPKYILEIGTYTGYSAICMAEGLQPEGKLVTLDINEELEPIVRNYIRQSGYGSQIDFRIGDAQAIIPSLSYSWDMIFIDADKESYIKYFEQTLPQLRKGGFMIIDNVLWSGKVADPDENDKATSTIRVFNQMVHEHPAVENVLFPIRDGLMVLRKI